MNAHKHKHLDNTHQPKKRECWHFLPFLASSKCSALKKNAKHCQYIRNIYNLLCMYISFHFIFELCICVAIIWLPGLLSSIIILHRWITANISATLSKLMILAYYCSIDAIIIDGLVLVMLQDVNNYTLSIIL